MAKIKRSDDVEYLLHAPTNLVGVGRVVCLTYFYSNCGHPYFYSNTTPIFTATVAIPIFTATAATPIFTATAATPSHRRPEIVDRQRQQRRRR